MHKRTNELNLIIELIYQLTKRDKLHRGNSPQPFQRKHLTTTGGWPGKPKKKGGGPLLCWSLRIKIKL